ncbi:MAG: NAD(P)-dependent oxidoreductase [Actinobacteria bacterium]|nr:NAD(P)-dependent oxidoreductase [Actinomycetota bacterium]
MLGLNDKLQNLQNDGKTINIAIAGIGQMGKGIIAHLKNHKSFRIIAVANRDINNSLKRMEELGYAEKDIFPMEKENTGTYAEELNPGNLNPDTLNLNLKNNIERTPGIAALKEKIILTNDLFLLSNIEEVDIIVDATGNPEAGAELALSGLTNKKHVVTLNVETDTAIGPFLKKLAHNSGVVYTVAAGDEPAALKELYDFANALNLEIIAAGKGKNNPLDHSANPSTLEEYSRLKGTSPKMMTSFVDGTKSMVEMACFSNATGIIPDCRGMHAPKANVRDLTGIFRQKKDGGILDKNGIVDFVIGDVAPGVFLVYSASEEILKKELKYLLFGDGPNYLLYRPFHLASIESPLSMARAYFYNEPTICPKNNLISEVITMAKVDLKPGDILDGIGGFKVYGLIELYDIAKKENLLPIGLSEGARVKNIIKKGETIKLENVDINDNSFIYRLRKIQEKLIN